MTEPVTVPADTTLTEAAQLMRDADIGDVIIVEDGQPRGMVTDRNTVVRAIAEHHSPDDTTVADIATRDLATVSPDDPVDRAVRLMRDTAVRHLPVVEDERLVGVVSLGDLAVERDEESALADISAADPELMSRGVRPSIVVEYPAAPVALSM
jgi:CBS domain-containing protein